MQINNETVKKKDKNWAQQQTKEIGKNLTSEKKKKFTSKTQTITPRNKGELLNQTHKNNKINAKYLRRKTEKIKSNACIATKKKHSDEKYKMAEIK